MKRLSEAGVFRARQAVSFALMECFFFFSNKRVNWVKALSMRAAKDNECEVRGKEWKGKLNMCQCM